MHGPMKAVFSVEQFTLCMAPDAFIACDCYLICQHQLSLPGLNHFVHGKMHGKMSNVT